MGLTPKKGIQLMEHKLNNGYIALVHYFDSPPRYFGPYPTPLKAFQDIQRTWKLSVVIPKTEMAKRDVFRPVLCRKYQVQFSKEGITALSIDVLEINQNRID